MAVGDITSLVGVLKSGKGAYLQAVIGSQKLERVTDKMQINPITNGRELLLVKMERAEA